MVKHIYLFFFLSFFCLTAIDVSAQIYFRDDNLDGRIDVFLFNGTVQGAFVIVEGSGSSSSQAINAYLPINDGANNVDFSTIDNAANMIFLKADTHLRTRFTYHNRSDRDHYANVAVRLNSSSDWLALSPTESNTARLVGPLSERDMTLTFSLDDLENVSGTTYQTTRETIYEVYIFFSDSIQDTNNIDPGNISGGVYFDLHFSQTLPSGSLIFTELLKGDGRLTAAYSGAQAISNNSLRYKILAFDVDTLSAGSNIQSVYGLMNRGRSGSILAVEEIRDEGSFSIGPLVNNNTYNIALSVEDKFQFSSALSTYLSETPEEISAFLDGQVCYLFSAGFDKNHYVVHFLRDFRNRHLLKSKRGRAFVKWYYQSAPRFAAMIYHSKILKNLIKGLGYFLYFFMNFFKSIIAVLCILLGLCLYRRYSH